MSCGSCGPVSYYPVHHAPGMGSLVVRETSSKAVTGNDGKVYPLDQPLVPAGNFPRGQWAAVIVVKGIPTVVHKNSAVETFNEAMRIFQVNEEDFWFMNIWLNLNLQWIPRVPAEYQIVTVAQLEAISHPVAP